MYIAIITLSQITICSRRGTGEPLQDSYRSSGPGSSLQTRMPQDKCVSSHPRIDRVHALGAALPRMHRRVRPRMRRPDIPLFHAILDLGHVRMVRAPPEPPPLEGSRVEDQTALVHELVRLERIRQDEL